MLYLYTHSEKSKTKINYLLSRRFDIAIFGRELFGIYLSYNQSHSRQTTAPSDEKYYFADSKYYSIRSSSSPGITNGKKFQLNIRSRKMKKLIA